MMKKWIINSLPVTALSIMSAVVLVGCAEMQNMPTEMQMNEQTLAAENDAAPVEVKPPIVNYKYATVTNLNMNNQGSQITIKPGQVIQTTLNYAYHCPKCDQNLNNQIIIGLANRSAQACIYNGGPEGQGTANFNLKVPAKPGRYDVRFRAVQATDCASALKAWDSDDSPTKQTTIGMITASKKAETLEQAGT